MPGPAVSRSVYDDPSTLGRTTRSPVDATSFVPVLLVPTICDSGETTLTSKESEGATRLATVAPTAIVELWNANATPSQLAPLPTVPPLPHRTLPAAFSN